MAKLCTKSTRHRFAPLILAVVLCVAPLSTSETGWTKLLYVKVKVPAQVLGTVSAQTLSVCRVLIGCCCRWRQFEKTHAFCEASGVITALQRMPSIDFFWAARLSNRSSGALYTSAVSLHICLSFGRLQQAVETVRLNDCKLQVRDLPAAT